MVAMTDVALRFGSRHRRHRVRWYVIDSSCARPAVAGVEWRIAGTLIVDHFVFWQDSPTSGTYLRSHGSSNLYF